ncbi:MAG: hypothetical protein Q8S31_10300 [Alphaproteobacteria bacterium]|nr:hypothetical protein [Alphaproteobacteria bacterium]
MMKIKLLKFLPLCIVFSIFTFIVANAVCPSASVVHDKLKRMSVKTISIGDIILGRKVVKVQNKDQLITGPNVHPVGSFLPVVTESELKSYGLKDNTKDLSRICDYSMGENASFRLLGKY